jgi:hypothetical protein
VLAHSCCNSAAVTTEEPAREPWGIMIADPAIDDR